MAPPSKKSKPDVVGSKSIAQGAHRLRLSESGENNVTNEKLVGADVDARRLLHEEESHQPDQQTAYESFAQSENLAWLALESSNLAAWDFDLITGKIVLSDIWSFLLCGDKTPTFTTFDGLMELLPEEDQLRVRQAILVDELLGKPATARSSKRGPTSKLQQQIDAISQLPKTRQRFVSEMLDTVLAQASR